MTLTLTCHPSNLWLHEVHIHAKIKSLSLLVQKFWPMLKVSDKHTNRQSKYNMPPSPQSCVQVLPFFMKSLADPGFEERAG